MKHIYQNPWPSHVKRIFKEIGRAMRCQRLYPEDIEQITREFGAILPDHWVKITHFSGRTTRRRGNYYRIEVIGSIYAGLWTFGTGQLEELIHSVENEPNKFD